MKDATTPTHPPQRRNGSKPSSIRANPGPALHRAFLAIDFETADYGPDSACAVGLVRVEQGQIVSRHSYLIRPPRRDFVFSYLHGITWNTVKGQPSFAEWWPSLSLHFRDIDFLVAHNARFDRSVLNACCLAAGLPTPTTPFQCTMRLARTLWGIRPTRLPDVCRHFGIGLKHHDAASDTEACAAIMIRALADLGQRPSASTTAVKPSEDTGRSVPPSAPRP